MSLPDRPHRGIYLLPNLFTSAGLFAGVYSILNSIEGNFEQAAMAIFVAMVMDGLDGRIARMTNTQTAFGAEYDSLADLVSFCMAPAFLAHQWALSASGKWGWVVVFAFVACGALRLARFNTQVGIADKRYFQGLATPSSAAVVAGLVWSGVELGIVEPSPFVIGLLLLGLGALNVSNFRYHSFKAVNWRERVPFLSLIIGIIVLSIVAYDPPRVLLTGFAIYALSGPVETLWKLRHFRLNRRHKRNPD